MSLILLLIISFLFGNIISNNEWVIQNAKSVICLSNQTGLNFYTISSNDTNLMIRSEDAYGSESFNFYDFEKNNFDDYYIGCMFGGTYSENILIFYEKYLQILDDKKIISKRYEIEP